MYVLYHQKNAMRTCLKRLQLLLLGDVPNLSVSCLFSSLCSTFLLCVSHFLHPLHPSLSSFLHQACRFLLNPPVDLFPTLKSNDLPAPHDPGLGGKKRRSLLTSITQTSKYTQYPPAQQLSSNPSICMCVHFF